MEEIKVESGIPIPERNKACANTRVGTLLKMEVGQSIVVDAIKMGDWYKATRSAKERSSVPMNFASRKIGNGKRRIWRVE